MNAVRLFYTKVRELYFWDDLKVMYSIAYLYLDDNKTINWLNSAEWTFYPAVSDNWNNSTVYYYLLLYNVKMYFDKFWHILSFNFYSTHILQNFYTICEPILTYQNCSDA